MFVPDTETNPLELEGPVELKYILVQLCIGLLITEKVCCYHQLRIVFEGSQEDLDLDGTIDDPPFLLADRFLFCITAIDQKFINHGAVLIQAALLFM